MQRNDPPLNPPPGDQDGDNFQPTENQNVQPVENQNSQPVQNQAMKVDPPQQEEAVNMEADQGMDIPFRDNSNADIYNRASPVTIQRCIYSGLPRVMRIGVPRGNNVRLNYYYKLPLPPFGPNMVHSQPPVQYQQQPNPYLHNQYHNTFEYPAYPSVLPQAPVVPAPEPLIDLYNPTNQPYPTCFNLRPEQTPHFQYQAPPFQLQAPHFQHQAPPFQHQASPFEHQAPPFEHQAPPFEHQAPPFQHQAPPFQHQAPPFSHQALPFHYQAPPFQHQAPPFQHQAPPFQHQAPPFQHQAPAFQHQAPDFQHAGPPFKYETPPVKYETPMGHYTPHTNLPAESAMEGQTMDASSAFNAQVIPQRCRTRPSRRDYEYILGYSELRPTAQEFVPRQNEARQPIDEQHFLGETEPVQTTGQAHHNQPQDTNAELIKTADEERKQVCSSRSVPVVTYTEANNVKQKPKKNGYKQIPDRAQNLNKIVPESTDTSLLNKNVTSTKRSADNQITNDLPRSGNLRPQNPEPRKNPLILRKKTSKQSTEKEKPLPEESDDLPGPLFKLCRNTKMARIIPNLQKEKKEPSTDTNIKLEVSLNDIPKLKPVDNVIIEIYDDNKLTVIEKNPVFDKDTLILIEGETNFHNKSGMGTSTSNNNQALTNGISDFQLAEPVSCDEKPVSSEINPHYDKGKTAIPKIKPSCKGTPFFCNKSSVPQNDKLDCENGQPDSNTETDVTIISSEPTTSQMSLNIISEEQNVFGMNTEASQHNRVSNVAAAQLNEIYRAPVVSERVVCENIEPINEGLKLLQEALDILENKRAAARAVVRTGRPLDPLLLLDIIAHDPQIQDFIAGTPYTNNGKDGGSSYDYYRLTDFQLCHLRHIPNNKFWVDYILDQKMLAVAGGPEAMPERKDELEAFSREIIIEALRRHYNVQDVESLRLCVINYLRKYPEYRLTLLEKLVKERQNQG